MRNRMRLSATVGSFVAGGALLLATQPSFAQTVGGGSTAATIQKGATATVTVSLSGATGVVGTQNDLAFDSDLTIQANATGNCAVTASTSCTSDAACPDLPSPFTGKEPCVNISAPDCEVVATTGKGGFFGFLPAGCGTTGGAACTSIRALILSLTDSSQAIPDGPLYTCVVTASATAADGAHSLPVSNVRTANSSGQAVCGGAGQAACTTAPVSLSVGIPPTFCVGDCNSDGEVFGNEVTIAINIVAGNADLSACQNADANGDGEVFGNEVTLAILNVANGCPGL